MGWCDRSGRVTGEGIAGVVLGSRDVHHAEAITEGLFFEVPKPRIGDVF